MTFRTSHHLQSRGFTLVELLVAMTVIGILVGMLAVGVNRVIVRAQEFAIQTEMQQLESALERFKSEYGFYPPSFAALDFAGFQNYINRIAPNNLEGVADANGDIPIMTWWTNTGADIQANPGADLVFWLGGLAKNKQRPLTSIVGGVAVPNASHDFVDGGDGVERQLFYEFKLAQVAVVGNAAVYTQASGPSAAYLYRNAGLSYIPQNTPDFDYDDPANNTGAYVWPTYLDPISDMTVNTSIQSIIDAAFHLDPDLVDGDQTSGLTVAQSQMIFNRIYPKPDSFQLISFGLDGMAGGPATCPTPLDANPNSIDNTCSMGADNLVNFGGKGIAKLEDVLFESL